MEEDQAKDGDESEIPAGLPATVFVGAIIISIVTLSLLLVSHSHQTTGTQYAQ